MSMTITVESNYSSRRSGAPAVSYTVGRICEKVGFGSEKGVGVMDAESGNAVTIHEIRTKCRAMLRACR